MNAGDFFWGDPADNRENEHPWVLLNTPCDHEDRAVLLNFTDLDDRDIPYFVDPGFHITITKRSVPAYGDMLVWDLEDLETAIRSGLMRETPPPLIAGRVKRLVNQATLLSFVSREIKRLIVLPDGY